MRRFDSAWRRRLLRFGRRENAPLREGSCAALYSDGGKLLAASRELIDRAVRTIDVEMYIWKSDEVGHGFVEALRAALDRGVKVRVLYDALGCWNDTAHLDALAASGALVEAFHPISRLGRHVGRRNHRKLLLVDDTVAILGGANWSNDYDSARFPEAFFGVGVGLSGPIVADLCEDFRRALRVDGKCEARPPEPPRPDLVPPGTCHRNVPVQLVSGLRRGDRSAIRHLYGLLLGAARERILVANSYFVPGARLARLFSRAAQRGVDVTLLLPGTSDVPMVKHAARATYGRLLRAGVRIFERAGRMVHAKAAVVDREVAVVGTANLDPRSLLHNLELNVNIHHREIACALERCVLAELAQSGEVTLPAWRSRPLLQHLFEQALYLLRGWL